MDRVQYGTAGGIAERRRRSLIDISVSRTPPPQRELPKSSTDLHESTRTPTHGLRTFFDPSSPNTPSQDSSPHQEQALHDVPFRQVNGPLDSPRAPIIANNTSLTLPVAAESPLSEYNGLLGRGHPSLDEPGTSFKAHLQRQIASQAKKFGSLISRQKSMSTPKKPHPQKLPISGPMNPIDIGKGTAMVRYPTPAIGDASAQTSIASPAISRKMGIFNLNALITIPIKESTNTPFHRLDDAQETIFASLPDPLRCHPTPTALSSTLTVAAESEIATGINYQSQEQLSGPKTPMAPAPGPQNPSLACRIKQHSLNVDLLAVEPSWETNFYLEQRRACHFELHAQQTAKKLAEAEAKLFELRGKVGNNQGLVNHYKWLYERQVARFDAFRQEHASCCTSAEFACFERAFKRQGVILTRISSCVCFGNEVETGSYKKHRLSQSKSYADMRSASKQVGSDGALTCKYSRRNANPETTE